MSTSVESPDRRTAASVGPLLLFVYSERSGKSRRAEQIRRIDYDQRPDLARRFGVTEPPVLVVVEDKRVHARLKQPRGCVAITETHAPWLR
jgi:hypothetical protein